MTKHRQRVQFRRKIAARNSEKTGYGDSLMDIYRRAVQGGSETYLATYEESEPDRIAKIQAQGEERRKRRNAKYIQASIKREPNEQPPRGNIRAKRIGKIRGFARRVLRKVSERSNSRASDSALQNQGGCAANTTDKASRVP